jgi:hypothetical protein
MQIFVEIERARLTRKLAAMKEAEGNITEAADILQEVPVVGRGGQQLLAPALWHMPCGAGQYLHAGFQHMTS